MRLFFRNFRFSMLLVSLLCIALGVALLLWPEQAQNVFCYAFGALLVLSGILETAMYLAGEKKGLLQTIMFLGGVIAAIVGVWILFRPSWVFTLAVIALGVVLLYHGVMDIKYAFDLKGYGSGSWGVALISGLITCGIGVLMLVNPFEKVSSLLFLVAAGFIFDGVTDFYTVFAVAGGARRYELTSAAKPAGAIEGTGTLLEERPTPQEAAAETAAAESGEGQTEDGEQS